MQVGPNILGAPSLVVKLSLFRIYFAARVMQRILGNPALLLPLSAETAERAFMKLSLNH